MPEASPSNPQPSPTQQTSQGINWKSIIIGVIVGAVLFGGGGFLVYNAYQPKKEEPAQTTTPTPKTATPSTTPKEKEEPKPKDETADWKTYKGTKFAVKHPTDWYSYDYYANWDKLTLKPAGSGKEYYRYSAILATLSHFPNYNEYYNGLFVHYRTDKTAKQLSEFCPGQAHGESCSVKAITINGLKGYEVNGSETIVGQIFLAHPDGAGTIDITPQETSDITKTERELIKKVVNTLTAS